MRHSVDVLVIGGGINGTGIARDCAMRGFTTLLVEKDDFAQGTTGGCSGMIHGGVKYLVNDLDVTHKSCLDSGYIQRIMPHLLFRIPLVFPIPKRMGGWIALEVIETYFEAYDHYVGLKNGKPHTRLTPQEVVELEPMISPTGISGAITLDEWGLNPYRACAINALGAAEAGAKILNHTQLVRFRFADEGAKVPQVTGALVRDTLTGEESLIAAKVIVNASGPWTMMVAAMAGARTHIRPSKGVHLVFDRRITNAGVLFNAIDGRSIFIIPYETTSILGTTDDDFFGDPDRVEVTHDEVEYLLASAETVIPDIRRYRIMRSYSALRPTIFKFGKNENDLSRDHKLYDHEALGECAGLVSIIGGKYAAYRIMSEEMTDLIAQKLGRPSRSTTHEKPLPGGEARPDAAAWAAEYAVDEMTVARLIAKYGQRAQEILVLMQALPETRRMACACEMVTVAEMRYTMKNEWARTHNDVRRRTRCGLGTCQGMRCAMTLDAEVAASPLSRDNRRKGLHEFFEDGHRFRMPVLKDDAMRQEELSRNLLLGAANLAAWLE